MPFYLYYIYKCYICWSVNTLYVLRKFILPIVNIYRRQTVNRIETIKSLVDKYVLSASNPMAIWHAAHKVEPRIRCVWWSCFEGPLVVAAAIQMHQDVKCRMSSSWMRRIGTLIGSTQYTKPWRSSSSVCDLQGLETKDLWRLAIAICMLPSTASPPGTCNWILCFFN